MLVWQSETLSLTNPINFNASMIKTSGMVPFSSLVVPHTLTPTIRTNVERQISDIILEM